MQLKWIGILMKQLKNETSNNFYDDFSFKWFINNQQ